MYYFERAGPRRKEISLSFFLSFVWPFLRDLPAVVVIAAIFSFIFRIRSSGLPLIVGVFGVVIFEGWRLFLFRKHDKTDGGSKLLQIHFTLTGVYVGYLMGSLWYMVLSAPLFTGIIPDLLKGTWQRHLGWFVIPGVAVLWQKYQLRYRSIESGRVVWNWNWSGEPVPSGLTSHGTAEWASQKDLVKASLLTEQGLILGRRMSPQRELITFDQPGHILTVAPTRTGKGVSSVIPNLLNWPRSVVVIDPKGENFAVTARARAAMKQAVFTLDPFCLCGQPSAHFNPMDLVDPQSPDVIDEASILAESIVYRKADSPNKDSFFENSARSLVRSLILFVACEHPKERRTLAEVRRLLLSSPDEWKRTLDRMSESEHAHGKVAEYAGAIQNENERTMRDILSTAKESTDFLDSPRMAAVLDRSDFDLTELRGGDLTVYLVLPPDKLDAYSRFLRLVIASCLHACVRTPNQPGGSVLFLLDEMAQLGYMQPLERAFTLLGGYGVKVWGILQDFGQLRQHYRDSAETILANATVKQFFGVSDIKTAELVSKMIGEATITVTSLGENRSTSGFSTSHGDSTQTSEKGRFLLKPDEVLRLPKEQEILLIQGQRAIKAEKVSYISDSLFTGKFDPNPYHMQDGAGVPILAKTDGELEQLYIHARQRCSHCKSLNRPAATHCRSCAAPL